MRNSSTSSSKSSLQRLPWAGLLALALLLVIDRLAFDATGVWAALSARDPYGIGTPHLAMQEIRREPLDKPRVLAVGPSRMFEGFSSQIASRRLPGVAFVKLTHPRFEAFVIRALANDLLAMRPHAAVFLWSELDTNRPLRLEPVPGSSAASLAAVWDLLRWTDLRFAIANRATFYRLVASSALDGYRYRRAIDDAGLRDTRSFTLDARLKPPRAFPRIFGEIVLQGAEPTPVSPAERERIIESFGPEADRRFVDLSIDFVAEITPGKHAELKRAFITRTVELLRAAGVEVIVVEGPLHPDAAELYDVRLREGFLAFMQRLTHEHGVRFTPLEELPHFEAKDFKDLLHVAPSGTLKLTSAILRALRPALPPKARNHSKSPTSTH
ncbi:MAG: hypothetical protein JRS35_15105 [Deltaproteobacteria bacterium]|nr:hypothetical protein [Deltaproteobacteria bacterium]